MSICRAAKSIRMGYLPGVQVTRTGRNRSMFHFVADFPHERLPRLKSKTMEAVRIRGTAAAVFVLCRGSMGEQEFKKERSHARRMSMAGRAHPLVRRKKI
ncbi:hypothetical protein GDO78_006547 [Eleutherodactylus coqui]|uniref:Uncharacterized protein n=1 Tax=Eleutherodactylus coqui TaxID=57060 RepID=A0A8J6FPR7_ELECQ|nr:hypothetical protein GDO78_006547 [Eleutherodactylus coqui]